MIILTNVVTKSSYWRSLLANPTRHIHKETLTMVTTVLIVEDEPEIREI